MNQSKKTYLYTNFKQSPNKHLTLNDLAIQSSYNLSLKNNIIEPSANFSSVFQDIFSENEYQNLIKNSSDFLKEIYHLEIYEYINNNNISNFRIFVLDKNFNLYEYSKNKQSFLSHSIKFSSFPKIFKNSNSLIFSSNNDKMVFIEQETNPITITPSPSIETYAIVEDTIYFTSQNNKYRVYYATNSSLLNISDELNNYNGFDFEIEKGEIVCIFNFNKKLYVVQQYRISKLEITSSNSSFINCCTCSFKIYKNSACLFEDYIIFNSSAGIFKFDGNDIKFIFGDITKCLELENSIGVSYNNKYYLKTKFSDDEFNILTDVLIEFDPENESYEIFSVGNISLIYTVSTSIHYYLIAITDEDNSLSVAYLDKLSKSTQLKYLQTNKFSFNSPTLKYIKDIYVSGYGSFDIVIKSDLDQKTIQMNKNLKFSNLSLPGHIFQLLIVGDSYFSIESISLTFIENGDYYD